MARKIEDPGSLKRLGGGRWQSRDERFTVEPQSGTWIVLDSEQMDDLGLPLVRGPFSSLTAAKAAIDAARETEPAVSPLAAKVAEHVERPATVPTRGGRPYPARGASSVPVPLPPVEPLAVPASVEPPAPPPAPLEAEWIQALKRVERARVHALIEKLERAGAPDPEGIAEREFTGKVPAVAAYALERALVALGPDADPAAVAALLAEGSAADLDVRWHLVDGDGRPITLPK